MTDRTLPNWFRVVLIVPAFGQTVFALTLLVDPSAVSDLWPWPMTPVSARILGASTLVSIPLAVIPAIVNRWSATRIPLAMLLTYRVFQLAAGLIHLDRFDFGHFPTWNYFAGGTALLIIYSYVLLRGDILGQPVSERPRLLPLNLPLSLGTLSRAILRLASAVFLTVGVVLLVLGPDASALWLEADGMLTPLTARLFSSPLIGLALGLWLISRASYWSQVAIPAIGLTTFGIAGSFAILMEWESVDPPTAFGYFIPLTAVVLLVVGLTLLASGRGASEPLAESAG
jgi:hypothetical protein